MSTEPSDDESAAEVKLERVLRGKEPLSSLRMIVEAHPEVLRFDRREEEDRYNRSFSTTALHAACRFGASLEVAKYLYTKDPEAASLRTSPALAGYYKRLPHHWAVETDTSSTTEIVKFLIDQNPSHVVEEVRSNSCFHLLHCICYAYPGTTLMEYAVKKYPEALLMRDHDGRTPLNLRAWYCQCWRELTPEQLFGALVDANPFTMLDRPTPVQNLPRDDDKVEHHRRYLQKREREARTLVQAVKRALLHFGKRHGCPTEVQKRIWIFIVPDFVLWSDKTVRGTHYYMPDCAMNWSL